jgi:ribosomal protein S14
MKLTLKHNLQRRQYFANNEIDSQLLKWALFSMISKKNCLLTKKKQKNLYTSAIYNAKLKLMLKKSDFSISKIKNVCYVSRRNRGVSRAFRLSRQSFKEQVQNHYFAGVTRFPAAKG